MKTFLEKDSSDNWNTVPPIQAEKTGNINCHKFVLYIIGKISWDEMTSDTQTQKESESDLTFGDVARSISDIPFTPVKDIESLLLLANKNCEVGKSYVGQILDAETGEMAHSFIIQREVDGKYICFDKPGFKYNFEVNDLEKILDFVNKDGDKSNQNQKWRFVPIN